jgi:hypothetical protein
MVEKIQEKGACKHFAEIVWKSHKGMMLDLKQKKRIRNPEQTDRQKKCL